IFVQLGQKGVFGFLIVAIIAILLLIYISKWYKRSLETIKIKTGILNEKKYSKVSNKVFIAIVLLVFLVFARSLYIAGINNFYQFYLVEEYGQTIQKAQIYIFIFMFSSVLGTFFGGPLADRFGKKNIMLLSMVGVAPFTLILPYLSLGYVM